MGTNAHSWDLSIEEASALQKRLREQVIEVDNFDGPHYVAGIDLSGVKSSGKATAAAMLLEFPSLEIVEEHIVRDYLRFPYISGFLSFREAPLMVEALRGLKIVPDLILVDGQGRAHPRGLGIASHLGLLLDRPTIGCAKSRLVGRYADPAEEAGNRESLLYGGKEIGTVLRTKSRVKPIFVSVGHRVSLPTAVDLVLRCTRPNQRIPEPTRQAHLAAGRTEEQ